MPAVPPLVAPGVPPGVPSADDLEAARAERRRCKVAAKVDSSQKAAYERSKAEVNRLKKLRTAVDDNALPELGGAVANQPVAQDPLDFPSMSRAEVKRLHKVVSMSQSTMALSRKDGGKSHNGNIHASKGRTYTDPISDAQRKALLARSPSAGGLSPDAKADTTKAALNAANAFTQRPVESPQMRIIQGMVVKAGTLKAARDSHSESLQPRGTTKKSRASGTKPRGTTKKSSASGTKPGEAAAKFIDKVASACNNSMGGLGTTVAACKARVCLSFCVMRALHAACLTRIIVWPHVPASLHSLVWPRPRRLSSKPSRANILTRSGRCRPACYKRRTRSALRSSRALSTRQK